MSHSIKRNQVILATRNPGKIAEFARLLEDFRLEVLGLEEFPELLDVEETGTTFKENALLKASYAARESGLVAVADDSGLIVDALGGAPGVYSARFCLECAGPPPAKHELDRANVRYLLEKLRQIPRERRTARFCSVIAAVAPDGRQITAEGFWPGLVAENPRGNNGFGYDPIFYDPELNMTAAEMDRDLKNSRSHRARALRELRLLWPGFWGPGVWERAAGQDRGKGE